MFTLGWCRFGRLNELCGTLRVKKARCPESPKNWNAKSRKGKPRFMRPSIRTEFETAMSEWRLGDNLGLYRSTQ